MKIYVVRYGQTSQVAFKNRADAEEYILHKAYLDAFYTYSCDVSDWDCNIKYRYNNYRHCFTYLGAYAMYIESIGVFIEEIELEEEV